MWKQKFKVVMWVILGASCIALMAASIKTKDTSTCTGVQIIIAGAAEHVFVKKADVIKILQTYRAGKGAEVMTIDLKAIEEKMEDNPWVKNAELYFDNNNLLNVKVTEKEPVARVFTVSGQSFYIDSAGFRLPTSTDVAARLPVFTGFPSDRKRLSKPDSAVLD